VMHRRMANTRFFICLFPPILVICSIYRKTVFGSFQLLHRPSQRLFAVPARYCKWALLALPIYYYTSFKKIVTITSNSIWGFIRTGIKNIFYITPKNHTGDGGELSVIACTMYIFIYPFIFIYTFL